jgi:hypothetical protein
MRRLVPAAAAILCAAAVGSFSPCDQAARLTLAITVTSVAVVLTAVNANGSSKTTAKIAHLILV